MPYRETNSCYGNKEADTIMPYRNCQQTRMFLVSGTRWLLMAYTIHKHHLVPKIGSVFAIDVVPTFKVFHLSFMALILNFY